MEAPSFPAIELDLAFRVSSMYVLRMSCSDRTMHIRFWRRGWRKLKGVVRSGGGGGKMGNGSIVLATVCLRVRCCCARYLLWPCWPFPPEDHFSRRDVFYKLGKRKCVVILNPKKAQIRILEAPKTSPLLRLSFSKCCPRETLRMGSSGPWSSI